MVVRRVLPILIYLTVEVEIARINPHIKAGIYLFIYFWLKILSIFLLSMSIFKFFERIQIDGLRIESIIFARERICEFMQMCILSRINYILDES